MAKQGNPMSLTPADVERIAHLARLSISEEEVSPLTKDLTNILTLVKKMDQENTRKIEPLAHPFDETQPLRIDQVVEVNQRDLLLKNAPKTSAGLFVVPQFVETE